MAMETSHVCRMILLKAVENVWLSFGPSDEHRRSHQLREGERECGPNQADGEQVAKCFFSPTANQISTKCYLFVPERFAYIAYHAIKSIVYFLLHISIHVFLKNEMPHLMGKGAIQEKTIGLRIWDADEPQEFRKGGRANLRRDAVSDSRHNGRGNLEVIYLCCME